MNTHIILPPGARRHHGRDRYRPQNRPVLQQRPHDEARDLRGDRDQIDYHLDGTTTFFRRARQ